MPRGLRAELFPLAAGGAGASEILERAEALDPALAWLPDKDVLERNAAALEPSGTRVLLPGENDYPPLLREIHDPPICLFVRGLLPEPQTLAVAIVGARTSVGNGVLFAAELARSLSSAGIPVVSGMARGIDGAAHDGCLAGGARTVAVLGCGADVCYPKDNRRLMERILEGGAVVSEYPMGTRPATHHFPARNRIISGWCAGTVVVEAARGSGALITAKYAAEQGRVVFAVPGAVWNPLGEGPNALIKDGAAPVRNAGDVTEELFGIAPRERVRRRARPEVTTGRERAVLCALDYDMPQHLDSLAAAANLPASRALTTLLELELKGLARQLSGKRFLRVSRGS
jgi:DNA processing protein